MENNNSLLIVVDAGHGGWDNGASFQGRLEKDDNLRLALEVRKQLEAMGAKVLMTRSTDVFVTLQDRAQMANQADADLFISLHRNSYTHQTPTTKGVENFIYLTAPEATSGRAATLVLDAVVEQGVQANRGVSRGNYYVVRRTSMPSMLLEMGFIINDEDNRLFDEKLVPYANAIARGALAFFGGAAPPVVPPMPVEPQPLPPSPVGPYPPQPVQPADNSVSAAQRALNSYFGSNLTIDGLFGPLTRAAIIRALQQVINDSCGTNLAVDGVLGPLTKAALPTFSAGDKGPGVKLVQIMLAVRGYDAGAIDGIYGPRTRTAVVMFQRDNYLLPDGVAGPKTITKLLS